MNGLRAGFRRFYSAKVPLEVRLFNLIFTFIIFVSIADVCSALLLHSTLPALLLLVSLLAVTFVCWLLGYLNPDHATVYTGIAVLYFCLIALPAIYLTGGSGLSGIAVHVVLALLSLYLLLGEKRALRNIVLSLYSVFLLLITWAVYSFRPGSSFTLTGRIFFLNGIFLLLLGVIGAGFFRFFFSLLLAENKSIDFAIEELSERNRTDALTGLYNRRHMYEILSEQVKLASPDRPLSLLLFDVDYFKRLNDEKGHLAGDEVLISLSRRLSSAVSEGEIAVRFGGEEFLLILPNTPAEQARTRAEALRIQIAKEEPVTVCAGVAVSLGGLTPEQLMSRADTYLYQAKAEGRNCVRGEQV